MLIRSCNTSKAICLSFCRRGARSPASVPADGLPFESGRFRSISGGGDGPGLFGATEDALAKAPRPAGADAHGGANQQGRAAVAAGHGLHASAERGRVGLGTGCQNQHLPGITAGLQRTLKTEQQSLRKVLHAGITKNGQHRTQTNIS